MTRCIVRSVGGTVIYGGETYSVEAGDWEARPWNMPLPRDAKEEAAYFEVSRDLAQHVVMKLGPEAEYIEAEDLAPVVTPPPEASFADVLPPGPKKAAKKK